MSMHPVYGQKLTRTQKTSMFGDDHSDDHRGIVQRNGKVAWILVKTGAQQTYPNEVSADCIKYCYSTKDGKANTAMKRAYEKGDPFMVKVVPDKSPDTYFWGFGKVHVLQENHEYKERCYRRFVVVKHEDGKEDDTEDANMGQKKSVAEASADKAVVTETMQTSKKRERDTEEVKATRVVHPATSRMRQSIEGVEFDSYLEKSHAMMMTLLSIKWQRNAPTVHGIEMGDGRKVSYTADFVVDLPNGLLTQTYLIEIKPQYPYDDEIRKAIGACTQLKVLPLFLFYNTKFRCPFEERWTGAGHGDYRHHDGIRGIKFSWNPRTERVDIQHDAAYTAHRLPDGTIDGGIDVRNVIGDVKFSNSVLDEAYELVDGSR